jgi:LytS/YehU family sensor histidine kinase
LKKSDKAPAMVLKLSDLINYMLYECNADTVPFDKEINFVKNYIEIEKMRHGENLEVQENIIGNTKLVNIAPMIILPFLENSFKHGVNEELESSKVLVELEITDNSLILKVENSRSDTQNLIQNGNGTGIGLKNVQRRLDLLYPEKYQLDLDENDGFFKVLLKIDLEN